MKLLIRFIRNPNCRRDTAAVRRLLLTGVSKNSKSLRKLPVKSSMAAASRPMF